MKNSYLLDSVAAWNELLHIKFRAVEAFELLKYFNAEVKPSIEAAQEANNGLFEKYGTAGENGELRVDPVAAPAKFKAFAKERQEFLDADSGVKPYARNLHDVLNGARDADMSLVTLMQLEEFFPAAAASTPKRKKT